MDGQLKKGSRARFLPALRILLPCVVVLFLVQACQEKRPAPTEETATTKKDEQPQRAKVVFRSLLAGRWYSGNAGELTRQIETFFQKADVRPMDNVIALILPHAGYDYSGQTAAFGLNTANRPYERIVIIGPSHNPYVFMEEVLSIPRATHYETPLGKIPLDVELIDRLLEFGVFQNVPRAHQNEHSVQIELPLLQYCQKNFKLVPIVAGRCSSETITKAGDILKSLVDRDTLVIASSDFVHYGPNYNYMPFSEDVPEQIKKLDLGAYKLIEVLDGKGFLEYRRKTGATICGTIPVSILLTMLSDGAKAELVKYTTSGELTGDFTNSVSYLSVAFAGTWPNPGPQKPQTSQPKELTAQDKKQLLTLARQSIVYALEKRRIPQASDLGVTLSDALRSPRAAFVTLKKNHQLRGCIGDIFPQRPLYKSVIANAINAAFNDRRFPQLAKEECSDIAIEISALTAPKPISSADEIRIGKDGVVLNKDGRSAVFLPQVAPEQGWNLDQMLTQLSLKAGLPGDAWRKGASFTAFQAVVFGENER